MPATCLDLRFATFDDYLQRHLSHSMRKNLRRKFRAAAKAAPLRMSVATEVSAMAGEVHALYEQVLARSPLSFERLTPAFFAEIGKRMPDRTRFFLWRQNGRLVAFSLCLVHDGTIYDEYLGMDYGVALDLHLYFLTLRDVLSWAMAHGFHTYRSTPLNYDPKLHLGFSLAPLDLYVRAASPALQPLVRHILPFVQPTRGEPALRSFPNAHSL
jgi:predicted N-acyltransferase